MSNLRWLLERRFAGLFSKRLTFNRLMVVYIPEDAVQRDREIATHEAARQNSNAPFHHPSRPERDYGGRAPNP